MPKITPPTVTPGDSTTVATTLSDFLIKYETTPTSVDVLNGGLTRENLETLALPITRSMVRGNFNRPFEGSVSRGATVNLDVFYDWFSSTPPASPQPVTFDMDDAVPVFGASFVVPWSGGASRVRVTGEVGFLMAPFGGIYEANSPEDDARPSFGFATGTAEATDKNASTDRLAFTRAYGIARLYVNGLPIESCTKLLPVSKGGLVRRTPKGNTNEETFNDGVQSVESPDCRWWTFETAFYPGDDSLTFSVDSPSPVLSGVHNVEIRLQHSCELVRAFTRNLTIVVER